MIVNICCFYLFNENIPKLLLNLVRAECPFHLSNEFWILRPVRIQICDKTVKISFEYISSKWTPDGFTVSLGPSDVPLDLGEGRFSFHLAIKKRQPRAHKVMPSLIGWAQT